MSVGFEPGKFGRPGPPAGSGSSQQGVPGGAPHPGAQSQAQVDGPGCREGELPVGSGERVEDDGRSEMAPETAQKRSRSHSPRCQGCTR